MSSKNRLKENFIFIKNAFRHYREIGMPLPSSPVVAEKIASLIPMDSCDRIVELGSGTGRVSREIIRRLKPQGRLYCVEKNEDFCAYLRETFSSQNVTVLNAPAESLLSEHPHLEREKVDCVVMSLAPLLSPAPLRRQWLAVSRRLLRRGGLFIVQHFIPVIGRSMEGWSLGGRRWCMGFPPFRVDMFRKDS